MQERYEQIMQEVDKKMSAIDLNGANIIADSKVMIVFLQEKLTQLKDLIEEIPLKNEAEEIDFFKRKKPLLMWRLIYFHKILRIESHRPPCNDMADEYYYKRQEELKLFFDRHVVFYQYYNGGSTYRDSHYFVRKNRSVEIDDGLCHWGDDPEFTTGYDNLVARIIATEMLYAYLTARKQLLSRKPAEETSVSLCREYKWTDSKTAAVELIYALHAAGSVNNGKIEIKELVELFEVAFNIDLSNVYHIFIALKNRKINRTAYLDLIRERLLKRLEEEDSK